MSPSNPVRLAEAAIGAVRLGVPAAAVVEAIPFPDEPALLPRRQGALAGVVEHLGRMVPVVDLARWVDVGVAPAGAQARRHAQVLVLHEDGRSIGLKVDCVGALVEVAADAVTRLHHDDAPEEVFHSVARAPDGGPALSLLDSSRLMRLAAAWCEDGAALAADAGVDAKVDAEVDATTRLYALLQAGPQRLGVPAEVLAEVIPMPRLERFGSGIDGAWCRWRGRHLPVLALSSLGIDAPAEQEARALLAVIERDGGALGLPVQAALQLQAFGGSGLRAPGGLCASVFDGDGQPLLLLDDAALFARFPEAALSHGGAGHAHPGGDARAANATAYIVFEADGLCATAIDAVERILSLSDAALDGNGGMAWEGHAIALRDLRHAALRAPAAQAGDQAQGHVMVVRGAGAPVGYAVARVHLLVPPGTGQLYRMGAGARALEFITTGDGAAQASYRIVYLAADAA